MAIFSGKDGAFVLGGILDGSPLVKGALSQGATQMNIDAASLIGVVLVGDTFTLAGESGTPTHTVTGGPYVAVTNEIDNLTFTPAIATGGVTDNAAVTFAANSVSQVTKFDLAVDLENKQLVFMSDKWYRAIGTVGKWNGSAEVALDYGDLRQKAFIDAIATTTPNTAGFALVLRVATSKQFYGAVVGSGFRVTQGAGDMVTAAFNFVGNGAVLPNWP